MSFAGQLIGELILTSFVLLWVRWAKLDIGLRTPVMAGVWRWSLLFIVWIVLEWVVLSLVPVEIDPAWLQERKQLSLAEDALLMVVIAPITEEILFRGALFSALMRGWGLKVAVTVPSVLWALLHFEYEPWLIASIAVSGVVLAIIRWKSGSLYVPIALHIAANLLSYLP
jgi:membrane protease YdiL (CAAX protease family)